MKNHISITIHPMNDVDEREWNDFLNKSSESTFFCTTGWWKTHKNVFILQVRDKENKLLAGVPFRILSVLPVLQKYFKSCWLDSSVLVSDALDAESRYNLKKKAFDFLLEHLKKNQIVNLTISSKTRSCDGDLFDESFGYSEKCATFVIDLNQDENDIFKSYSKGRKSSIKQAEKMGVEVRVKEGQSAFSIIPDYCYLENKLFDSKHKTYSDLYYKSESYLKSLLSSSDKSFVAIAYYNDKPVAGSIILVHKMSMYYYLGASDVVLNRETNASSFLKHQNIKFGMQMGYQTFDLGGIPAVPPEPSDSLFGVYKFKKDFGGERQEFDCSGYTIYPLRYRFLWKLRKFESSPLARRIYKLLKGSNGD